MKVKRLLSAVLSAAMLTGCLTVAAGAAETMDEPSGSSYRDEFIAALLKNEDKWKENSWGYAYRFVDFDFDGNLELIKDDGGGSSGMRTNEAYYLNNGDVEKVLWDRNDFFMFQLQNTIAYYDKTDDGYRIFSKYSTRSGFLEGLREECTSNFEVMYNNGILSFNLYSYESGLFGYNNDGSRYPENVKYYDCNNNEISNEISEDEYNKLNNAQIINCVDVNMQYDTLNASDYSKLSNTEKKAALEKLYDSFTYDKYGDTDTDNTDTENTDTESTDTDKPNVDVKTTDYKKYVENVLAPKYGYADTNDMTRTISVKDLEGDREGIYGWAKRSGILGYNIEDMNNDGIDELLVYLLDSNSQSSKLKIESYALDSNGKIQLKNSVNVFEETSNCVNYCVSEIAEANGVKYLIVETIKNASFFSNGQELLYKVYKVEDNEKIFLKYSIGMNGAASSPIRDIFTTCDIVYDGNKTTVKTANEIIYSSDNNATNISRNEALQSAFKKIGFSATDKTVADVFESLGFKNYKSTNDTYLDGYDGYPTYFFDNNARHQFIMINAPVDMTYKTFDYAYEFKSIVKASNNNNKITDTENIDTDKKNNTTNSTTTAGTNNAGSNGKPSGSGVTTGDITNVTFMIIVFAVSGVILTMALKRRKSR